MTLTHRIATLDDEPKLKELMRLSIQDLQIDFLTPEQIEASHDCMGLDTQLIKDQTYFIIEDDGEIAGCGGWSNRQTLFGASHSTGRDDSFIDPAKDPARIRATYTHPNFARRGVGKLIMKLCEGIAREKGFKSTVLAATLAGEKLFTSCGYKPIERFEATSNKGVEVPMVRMGKKL